MRRRGSLEALLHNVPLRRRAIQLQLRDESIPPPSRGLGLVRAVPLVVALGELLDASGEEGLDKRAHPLEVHEDRPHARQRDGCRRAERQACPLGEAIRAVGEDGDKEAEDEAAVRGSTQRWLSKRRQGTTRRAAGRGRPRGRRIETSGRTLPGRRG